MERPSAVDTMAPMKKKPLALSRVYRLIEPGPVVLLTTSRKGRANVMPMSWHTMIDFDPPILGFVLSDGNYSFQTLKTTRECVVNIPTVELASKVVQCGNASGRDGRQARDLRPHAGARQSREGPPDRRVLRRPGMPGHRHEDGGPVRLLRPPGREGVDRFVEEGPSDDPPCRQGVVHGRRQDDQAAVKEGVTRRRREHRYLKLVRAELDHRPPRTGFGPASRKGTAPGMAALRRIGCQRGLGSWTGVFPWVWERVSQDWPRFRLSPLGLVWLRLFRLKTTGLGTVAALGTRSGQSRGGGERAKVRAKRLRATLPRVRPPAPISTKSRNGSPPEMLHSHVSAQAR